MGTLPVSQFNALKYLGIYIDDLWLYYYDKRSYNGTMLDILNTVDEIEQVKWSLFKFATKIDVNGSYLPGSNYT